MQQMCFCSFFTLSGRKVLAHVLARRADLLGSGFGGKWTRLGEIGQLPSRELRLRWTLPAAAAAAAGVEQHRKYAPPKSQPAARWWWAVIVWANLHPHTNAQLADNTSSKFVNMSKIRKCQDSMCFDFVPCRNRWIFTWVEPAHSNCYCSFWHLHHQ